MKKRTEKKWTGMLCLMLTLGAVQTAYAAGPAEDREAILEKSVQEQMGSGPAAAEGMSEVSGQAVSEAGSSSGTETAQTEETQQVPEGMVASGGRFINPNQPMLALTFDDGPYASVGNRIMDCLEAHQGRATFFMVGNRVASYADEVRRMKQNGHEAANHTQEHRYLKGLSKEQVTAQVEGCNQSIEAVTGDRPALMRLPGGLYNSTVLEAIQQSVIMWNIDTRDWKTRNADSTVQAVLGKVQDGDIVLMHELYESTAAAVEQLVPALAGQGYQLVTVSELASFRGGMEPGKIYYEFRP